MYERNNSFRKFKEMRMQHLRLRQQDFANNTNIKKQVKVTYMVREWHEAIVAIDESLDDDEIYAALASELWDVNESCSDDYIIENIVDENSMEIRDFGNTDNIELSNRYYLLKKVDGKFVGGIALSGEV
jgi:hypothetical protein